MGVKTHSHPPSWGKATCSRLEVQILRSAQNDMLRSKRGCPGVLATSAQKGYILLEGV